MNILDRQLRRLLNASTYSEYCGEAVSHHLIILEYSCEVWSYSITQYQTDELERVQKRVTRIIFPGRTHDEALVIASCEKLDIRRKKICIKLYAKLLHKALLRNMCYKLEKPPTTIIYKCRTERFKNSFFPSTIAKINQ